MYLGYYISSVSHKNQLTFPVKLQNGTKDFLLTTWFENSLVLLPFENGSEVLGKVIGNVSQLLPEVRDLERFFFGNALKVQLDKKNRFVIPKTLRDFSKIGNDAVFLGLNERIEIWDYELYQNYGKIRESQIRELAIKHYNRITQKNE